MAARSELNNMANSIISSTAISTISPSFVAHSQVTDYVVQYSEVRGAGCHLQNMPPCAELVLATLGYQSVLPSAQLGPHTRGINDASPQSCSCPTFKYRHDQLHLCSTAACSLQPAATCCKLLMQIFDKCIWSILLWVGTSCQAATFSFNIARHSFYIFHNPQ